MRVKRAAKFGHFELKTRLNMRFWSLNWFYCVKLKKIAKFAVYVEIWQNMRNLVIKDTYRHTCAVLTDRARFKYDLQNLSMISYATRAFLDFLCGVMILRWYPSIIYNFMHTIHNFALPKWVLKYKDLISPQDGAKICITWRPPSLFIIIYFQSHGWHSHNVHFASCNQAKSNSRLIVSCYSNNFQRMCYMCFDKPSIVYLHARWLVISMVLTCWISNMRGS